MTFETLSFAVVIGTAVFLAMIIPTLDTKKKKKKRKHRLKTF